MAIGGRDAGSVVGSRSDHGNRHTERCTSTICDCYRDGLISASLIVRREGHDLLACDLEDLARASYQPEFCEHPFWQSVAGGGEKCRTCGADVSHLDPMGG